MKFIKILTVFFILSIAITNRALASDVTASVTVTVAQSYKITVTLGTGCVSDPGTSTVNQGVNFSTSIGASEHYTLSSLSIDGVKATSWGPRVYFDNVQSDHTVVLGCTPEKFIVGRNAGTGGDIILPSKLGNELVSYGDTIDATISPLSGYSISSVSGCGGKLSGTTYTTGKITSDCTITASFVLKDDTNTCSNGANNPPLCDSFPPMSGSINASTCSISSGNSSCSSSVTWSTLNPEGTSAVTTPTNITVGTGNNGTESYTIGYGSRTFYLYNNAKLLDQVTVNTNCVSGNYWDGSKCVVDVNNEENGDGNNSTCSNGATNPPDCTDNSNVDPGDGDGPSSDSNVCPNKLETYPNCILSSDGKSCLYPEDVYPNCIHYSSGVCINGGEGSYCLFRPTIDLSVLKGGQEIDVYKKVKYNSVVDVKWSSTNADNCSCKYFDSKNNNLNCGSGESGDFVTSSGLKRDTTYTVSCSNLSFSEEKSIKVLVAPINAQYVEQ